MMNCTSFQSLANAISLCNFIEMKKPTIWAPNSEVNSGEIGKQRMADILPSGSLTTKMLTKYSN